MERKRLRAKLEGVERRKKWKTSAASTPFEEGTEIAAGKWVRTVGNKKFCKFEWWF